MVSEYPVRPGASGQLCLIVANDLSKDPGLKGGMNETEIEGQLALIIVRAIIGHEVFWREINFTDDQSIAILIKERPKRSDDLMDFRLVCGIDVEEPLMRVISIPVGILRLIPQQCIFDQEPDHIDSEAIDTAFEITFSSSRTLPG